MSSCSLSRICAHTPFVGVAVATPDRWDIHTWLLPLRLAVQLAGFRHHRSMNYLMLWLVTDVTLRLQIAAPPWVWTVSVPTPHTQRPLHHHCKENTGTHWQLNHNNFATCLTQGSSCMGMGFANVRWHYIVKSSLIGWAHTQNDPCDWTSRFKDPPVSQPGLPVRNTE